MNWLVAVFLLCHPEPQRGTWVAASVTPPPRFLAASGARNDSEKLTAAAENLFAAEQKAAAAWRDAAPDEAVDATMYEDVLSLLDAAIRANPDNLHAYAFASQVLFVKADQNDGTYDICALLDARDDAEYVTARAGSATAPDLAAARGILKQIRRIPPSAIPDPPSSCGDDDHDHSSKTSETR